MICFLTKVFQESDHADAFLRGEMFANRLSHFMKIEGHDGRGDKYEGAIMPQIDNLTIELAATNMETGEVDFVTIAPEELSGPPILHPNWFRHVNVFCMYAAHVDGSLDVECERFEDIKSMLEIPEAYLGLGEHAVVITNVTEFLRRVKLAAERKGFGIYGKLVNYYDPSIGVRLLRGNIDSIFTKRKEYEWQREFRLAIDTRTSGCAAITLDVGYIRDIAVRIDTSQINEHLHVRLKRKR